MASSRATDRAIWGLDRYWHYGVEDIGAGMPHPLECDFTLSSFLEDTAGHSLSLPCLEWEVPREFLLHRSELIPPPVLGFERFEENKYTSIKRRRMIVQCKEEDVEKNGY